LDSSLKKHTTLLNRIRTLILVGPAEVIIKEIDGLTLTKYLEEIVGAVIEGVSRGRGDPDVSVDVSILDNSLVYSLTILVQVIVHLHTRLTPDFLPLVISPLLAILSPPPSATSKDVDKEREKEDKDRLAKQRPVLRIVAELAMIGAWPEGVGKGAGELGKVLKATVSYLLGALSVSS
jgi:regulator of nonsense transcripts 2